MAVDAVATEMEVTRVVIEADVEVEPLLEIPVVPAKPVRIPQIMK